MKNSNVIKKEKELIPDPICAAFKCYTYNFFSTPLLVHKPPFHQDKPKVAPPVPRIHTLTHTCSDWTLLILTVSEHNSLK